MIWWFWESDQCILHGFWLKLFFLNTTAIKLNMRTHFVFKSIVLSQGCWWSFGNCNIWNLWMRSHGGPKQFTTLVDYRSTGILLYIKCSNHQQRGLLQWVKLIDNYLYLNISQFPTSRLLVINVRFFENYKLYLMNLMNISSTSTFVLFLKVKDWMTSEWWSATHLHQKQPEYLRYQPGISVFTFSVSCALG